MAQHSVPPNIIVIDLHLYILEVLLKILVNTLYISITKN